jgi:hypothetical protein
LLCKRKGGIVALTLWRGNSFLIAFIEEIDENQSATPPVVISGGAAKLE